MPASITVNVRASFEPPPRSDETEELCSHCERPLQSPDVWTCHRGYPAGICEGITRPHVHCKCIACSWEELYEVPEEAA